MFWKAARKLKATRLDAPPLIEVHREPCSIGFVGFIPYLRLRFPCGSIAPCGSWEAAYSPGQNTA